METVKKDEKMENILVEAGLVSQEQVQKAKDIHAHTGEKLEKLILNEGMENYKQTMVSLAQKMGLEFIELENVKVNKEAVAKLSPEVAKKYSVFPFDLKDNILSLAMNNPDDIFVIDEIKVFSQTEIKPFLGDKRLINEALKYFYKLDEDAAPAQVDTKPAAGTQGAAVQGGAKQSASDANFNDIDNFIRSMILKAIKLDATDIHIDTLNGGLRIRYRIDGKLSEDGTRTPIGAESIIVRLKVMAGLFTSDRNVPQKGRITHELNKKEKIYVEALTLPTINGEKILLKLENMRPSFKLDELGLSEFEKNSIDVMFRRKSGMIIITGLNGSGKSTTAYALLKKIMSNDLNIITLEKKILGKIEGINQIQITGKQEENIAPFVKSAIEHDPDVLLVDVEPDGASLKQLMSMALGGKLVILTLSFPNSFEALSGLINMGLEPYMVAASVEGVIAQHLVRRLCTKCGNKHLKASGKADGGSEPRGGSDSCHTCNNTGYKGKIGVFEVFNMNKEYRKLLGKAGNMSLLESKMGTEKSTFEKNCVRLVNDEVTSIEEIIRSGLGKGIFEN